MKIAEDERPFLAAEARALAEHLDEPLARERFETIAAAAEAGEIPESLAESVGTLAGLALETGRVRTVHGAPGVRAMVALWKRTPQGEAAADEAAAGEAADEPAAEAPVGMPRTLLAASALIGMSLTA